MEKIKPNYKICISILIITCSLFVLILNCLESITNNQVPYMLLIGPYFAIIFYFGDKNAKSGFYFAADGISIKNKKNEKLIPWNKVKVRKHTSNKYEIQISKYATIKPFNFIDHASLVSLTKKYCPRDHDLYTAVQKYAKEENIPF